MKKYTLTISEVCFEDKDSLRSNLEKSKGSTMNSITVSTILQNAIFSPKNTSKKTGVNTNATIYKNESETMVCCTFPRRILVTGTTATAGGTAAITTNPSHNGEEKKLPKNKITTGKRIK